jgi:phospholipase C
MPPQKCPAQDTALSYVSKESHEVDNYITLIQNFSYASHVLQSNEGPSFVSHQYAIAGQSGGFEGSIAPYALVENTMPMPPPGAPIPDDKFIGQGSCATGTGVVVKTTDMRTAYPGNEASAPTPFPCNDYTTILDKIWSVPHPRPAEYLAWQYIAKDTTTIWSGPMAVTHHWNTYNRASDKTLQPFAVDPDAENLILNLTNSMSPPPSPVRPFAELTFITPCVLESDHPNFKGSANGPQWLAYVLNAIGGDATHTANWQNTAVIVTWDDWGGWFDNYRGPQLPTPAPWPFHPAGNPYHNAQDPNEWGIRVPLIVISPYVKAGAYTAGGYISSQLRSQGAILNFIEQAFSLGPNVLHADDATNTTDDLGDMFDFGRQQPLAWSPLLTTFMPTNNGTCPPN